MAIKTFNKLVRDKIPQICAAENQMPDFYKIASDEEFLKHLLNKLHEEADEMTTAPCVEEAADILEVLLAIGTIKGYALDELITAAKEKRAKKGGFAERFFMCSVEDKNNGQG